MKLTWSTLATVFTAASVVNAHFQVAFPTVRGPFVEDNEPNFCDGYTEAANRSLFPLTNGFITWESEHPSWTVGVLISTSSDPTNFTDFHTSSGADQLVVGYFQGNGTTGLCVSVKPTAAGISGIQDGSNVTFQMVFNGGDGVLYQCMDVTLSSNYTIPSNITCTNPEGQPPSNTTTTKPSSGAIVSTSSGGFLGLILAGILAAILI